MRFALEAIGAQVLRWLTELGRASQVAGLGALSILQRPVRLRLIIQQIEFVGVESLGIVMLCAAFTGAVLTWESYDSFALFGMQSMISGTVGVSVTRELAPVLTSLLVAGRAGSAMAAEIGSMQVTEQVDALKAMAVDPINYLVKPRLVAAVTAIPLLTVVFDVVAITGSYVISMYVLNMSKPEFFVRLEDWVDWNDISAGLIKSTIFGALVGVIGCYKGLYATGGAAGVGRATTSAVVVASVAILVLNYFIAIQLPN